MLKLKLEKNIPVPVGRASRKYNFHELKFEVNDSVLITDKKVVNAFLSHLSVSIKKRNPEHKYISRQVGDNQWRIWRIK
tara:strand:- start:336 stop:572 length:237 start_codon:yes stop_codon:yes gene_type:complete